MPVAAPASPDFGGDLIAFRSVTTRPRPANRDQPLFSLPIDRPVCRLIDCVLITGGRAVHAELGRGLVALSNCARSPPEGRRSSSYPPRSREIGSRPTWMLDQCTLTSERTIVRMGRVAGPGAWAGSPLVDHLAKLRLSGESAAGRRAKRSCSGATPMPLRAAASSGRPAMMPPRLIGSSPWEKRLPPSNRPRDAPAPMGPVLGAQPHRSRLRPRAARQARRAFASEIGPGRATPEPADLILDATYHPDRPELTVGAELVTPEDDSRYSSRNQAGGAADLERAPATTRYEGERSYRWPRSGATHQSFTSSSRLVLFRTLL